MSQNAQQGRLAVFTLLMDVIAILVLRGSLKRSFLCLDHI